MNTLARILHYKNLVLASMFALTGHYLLAILALAVGLAWGFLPTIRHR